MNTFLNLVYELLQQWSFKEGRRAMAEPNPSAPTSGGQSSTSGGAGAPPNIQKLVASKRLQQAQAQVRHFPY